MVSLMHNTWGLWPAYGRKSTTGHHLGRMEARLNREFVLPGQLLVKNIMKRSNSYLMENDEEAFRLDIKTDPEAVREQALWCGIKPGLRVLDVGCGPGKTTSILREMVQPNGQAVGIDFSAP